MTVADNDGVTVTVVDDVVNDAWEHSGRGTSITVRRRPVIDRSSAVMAVGSCFAVEIRAVLRREGFTVLPAYFDLEIDLAHERVGRLPERDNVNHYDTFSIRHEFEQAFGEIAAVSPDHFWPIDSPAVRAGVGLGGNELFQNPFRKRVFADSLDRLAQVSTGLDDCIGAAIRSADVYVITLGMIETWRDRTSGRYLCRRPDEDHMADCEFVLSDVVTNLDNMRRVCSLLARHRPGRPVILTVSPVSIARTYTERDIVVANTETKSLLRTVAGQMEREFDDVIYWPSYEIALREDIYAEDGRHISPRGVQKVVRAFLEAHCAT
jgi:hypothetical protein